VISESTLFGFEGYLAEASLSSMLKVLDCFILILSSGGLD